MSLAGPRTLHFSLASTVPCCIMLMTSICVALQARQFFSPGSGPSSPLRTPERPMWSCEPGPEVGGCDGRVGSAGQAVGCADPTGQGQEWD